MRRAGAEFLTNNRRAATTARLAFVVVDIQAFLEKWIPVFEAENRSYMNIAIGCTGGYHRSVYFCERLGEHLRSKGKNIIVRHRELS